MLFALNVTQRDGWTVVRVVGDVDLATVPQFRHGLARVASTGPVALALDLTAVDHLDSIGLGVIVGARRRVRERGGQLYVVASGPVRELFDLTGLDRIMPVGDELPVPGQRAVSAPAASGPTAGPPETGRSSSVASGDRCA